MDASPSVAVAAKLWRCSRIGCLVNRSLVHCARMLKQCASLISAPVRSISFINQQTLTAGTQRLAFDLMRSDAGTSTGTLHSSANSASAVFNELEIVERCLLMFSKPGRWTQRTSARDRLGMSAKSGTRSPRSHYRGHARSKPDGRSWACFELIQIKGRLWSQHRTGVLLPSRQDELTFLNCRTAAFSAGNCSVRS